MIRVLLLGLSGLRPVLGQYCGGMLSCTACVSVAGCVWDTPNVCVAASTKLTACVAPLCINFNGGCPAITASVYPLTTYVPPATSTVYPAVSTYLPATSTIYPSTTVLPAASSTVYAGASVYARPSIVPSVVGSAPISPIYTPLATPILPASSTIYPSTTVYPATSTILSAAASTYLPTSTIYPATSTILPAATSTIYPTTTSTIYPATTTVLPASYSTSFRGTVPGPIYNGPGPIYNGPGPIYNGPGPYFNGGVRVGGGFRGGGDNGLFDFNGGLNANIRNSIYANALDPIIPGIGATINTVNDVSLLSNSGRYFGNIVGGNGYNRDPLGSYVRNQYFANQIGDFVPGISDTLNSLNKLNLVGSLF